MSRLVRSNGLATAFLPLVIVTAFVLSCFVPAAVSAQSTDARAATGLPEAAVSTDAGEAGVDNQIINGGVVQHTLDFTGDGRTDFTLARNQGGSIVWYAYDGVTPLPGGYTTNFFGLSASDTMTPEDFDGDDKTDLAVWRSGPGGVASFYILQSSNGTYRVETFGMAEDDPAIVGDYDGDGRADPAVYRCPLASEAPGQCFFYYRGSLNNPAGNYTAVPWGFGRKGDLFPYIGDFDGDNKNDFCIQRANPSAPTSGQFVLLRSSDLGVEYINWGLSSDFLIPGDYDGDGKTDICVRRTQSSVRHHYVLTRTGTFIARQWGITGDSSAPGDYDRDGKTDFAVWRGSSTPGQSAFYVLNSSNGLARVLRFGQCATISTCDFAVAGWSVH